MREVEISEEDTIESLVNQNGTSMESAKALNPDKDFTTFETGDKINLPDGPLPDLSVQKSMNEEVSQFEPRTEDSGFEYVDATSGYSMQVSSVNPNHQINPEEIDNMEFTPTNDMMGNISRGDLKRGMEGRRDKTKTQEYFDSTEKALAQMWSRKSLGLKDEKNKDKYEHAYQMVVPGMSPETAEATEQTFGEFGTGVAKGLLGLPSLAMNAQESASEFFQTDEDEEVEEIDSVNDFVKNAQQTALNVVGSTLFPSNFAGDRIEEVTGENPMETTIDNINNLAQASYDSGNEVLPSEEDTREIVEKQIDKHIDNGNMPSGTKQRMIDNTVSKLHTKAKSMKSDVNWAGTIGEIAGTLPLAFASEMAVFHGTMRALPSFSNPVLSFGKTGLSSVASGVTTGGLEAAADTSDPNEIVNRGIADGVLNLGIDVMLPATVASTAKTVDWTGSAFKYAKDFFKRADDHVPDESFQDALKNLNKARKASDDEETLKFAKRVKENIEQAELDPKIPDISSRITENFEAVFGSRKGNDIGDLLEYKYDKRAIQDLSNTELLHFDTYLAKARRNDDFGDKISETFNKYKQERQAFRETHVEDEDLLREYEEIAESEMSEMEELILEETDERLLRESGWFNTDSLLPGESTPDNPFMQKIVEGEKVMEGQPGNARLTDFGEDYSGLWHQITKRIGPSHIMAQRTEATSGVKMGLAVQELVDSVRRAQSEFRNGIKSVSGLQGIDEFFSEINMYNNMDKELQDDVFRFMMDKEYSAEQITEEAMENSEYIRTDEQKELVKFARDWLDEISEYTDLEPKDMIKNYVPRRLTVNDGAKTRGKKVAEFGQLSEELPSELGFEKGRTLGDLNFDEFQKMLDNISTEDFDVNLDTDLQRVMKSYLWGLTRKRHLNKAIESFENQVDKLKAQNHPDAEYWDRWAREMADRNNKGGVDESEYFGWLANGIDSLDANLPGGRSEAGQKLRDFVENKDIADLIMSGTYGQYLFADQMFRVMNAGQTALTKARLGEKNFKKSFFDPVNNKRLVNMFGDKTAAESRLDKVLENSNIRGPSDQFVTGAKTEFGETVAGKESNKGMLSKLWNQYFSFENISASDRFNVRNAFYTAVDTIDRNADDYVNGSMSWDDFLQETKLHRANETVQSHVKDAIDNGKVGALKVTNGAGDIEKGTNIRVNEYLSMDADKAKELSFEFDTMSAESIFGKDTVYNTQWNYGKGAMGSFFWRSGRDQAAKIAQAATLPFQTWWINMLYQSKDMLVDNPANADQMVNLLTTQTAYADAASQIFDEDTERWIAPMSIPSTPFSSPPGQALISALRVANLTSKEQITTDGLNQYQRMKRGESMSALANYLYGNGTLVGRASNVIDESLKMYSSGTVHKQRLINLIDAATGVKFKNNDARTFANKLDEEFRGEF